MNFTGPFGPQFMNQFKVPEATTPEMPNVNNDPSAYFTPKQTGCGMQPTYPMMGQSCCPTACPTYQQCNQVVNKCFVQDVPHYINYHTHVVNNCVRRHMNVPTYSMSESVQEFDEFNQAPIAGMPFGQNPGYNTNFTPNNTPFGF